MYARIENGKAIEYPLFEGQIVDRFPEILNPLDPLPEGYVKVNTIPFPNGETDDYQYRYEIGLPIFVDGEWIETYDKIELTQEEKNIQEIYLKNFLRKKRNTLLSESDTFVVIDKWEDMTSEKKQEWKNYRHLLRNVPQQESFPYNVSWPIKPF